MTKFFLIFVLGVSLLFARCTSNEDNSNITAKDKNTLRESIRYPEHYTVYKSNGDIKVDGKLDEMDWNSALWSSDFVDIEGDKRPKPLHKTNVKILWDSTYLYFGAKIYEPHIWANLTKRDAVIFYDNDFEIFLDPDGDNHRYMEFEINALNTVWDLLLIAPYRDMDNVAVDSWDITGLKTGVDIRGTLNNPSDIDSFWTVEVAIPFSVLEENAKHNGVPFDGELWRAGFSRVNWQTDIKNGKYEKRLGENGKPLPEFNWVWSEQGAIAMHQPETWGYLQFSSLLVTESVKTPVKKIVDDKYADKLMLIELYKQEREAMSKSGRFLSKKELNISNKEILDNIQVEITSTQFLITYNGVSIDQHSRILEVKKK